MGREIFSLSTRLAYDHLDEFQADQTALRYLYRAGYDPLVLVSALEDSREFMEEDKKEYDKDLAASPRDRKNMEKNLFISHPHIENRIVNARNFFENVRRSEKVKYDPKQFNF